MDMVISINNIHLVNNNNSSFSAVTNHNKTKHPKIVFWKYVVKPKEQAVE